jgi:hypothetical protein
MYFGCPGGTVVTYIHLQPIIYIRDVKYIDLWPASKMEVSSQLYILSCGLNDAFCIVGGR